MNSLVVIPALARPAGILLAALLLVSPRFSEAQTITPVGTDLTFDVASWNIENLAIADPQMANAAATMRQAGIDLWGVQEITSRAVYDELLSRLGDGWAGVPSTSQNLFTAVYYREDVVSVRASRTILTPTFDFDFAWRPPLLVEIDVTMPDTTVRMTVLTVHMKCCSDLSSFQRRKAAAVALKNRLDFFHGSERVMVLGDFNDETNRSITSGQDSPYAPFVADPNYRFLIADGNVGTWCGNSSTCRTGSTIDNILISDELEGAFVEGSADRYASLLTELPGYTSTTSDHLPVYARFAFVTSTSTEPGLPLDSNLSVWPIPANNEATLRIPSRADFEMFDLMGRRVDIPHRRAGADIHLDLEALVPGLYILRVMEKGRVSSLMLPVSR